MRKRRERRRERGGRRGYTRRRRCRRCPSLFLSLPSLSLSLSPSLPPSLFRIDTLISHAIFSHRRKEAIPEPAVALRNNSDNQRKPSSAISSLPLPPCGSFGRRNRKRPAPRIDCHCHSPRRTNSRDNTGTRWRDNKDTNDVNKISRSLFGCSRLRRSPVAGELSVAAAFRHCVVAQRAERQREKEEKRSSLPHGDGQAGCKMR